MKKCGRKAGHRNIRRIWDEGPVVYAVAPGNCYSFLISSPCDGVAGTG